MNKILSMLSGRAVDESIIDQGFVGNSQQTAGCFIKTHYVNSISEGTVIAVEKDPRDDTWAVTVEIDSDHWLRYCNLSATTCISGRPISQSNFIGYSHKGIMRLEYCNGDKSQFPVRINNTQLYKQDPTVIIFSEE